ncbi:MAG: NAD(P)/FAD-dependent oxidoreductase [Burkholderiales bacterium]|nr:MAG: NAD(P)/FAD-dependent oxidoreductase [Burkholderiales bacterium]
MIIGAGPAGLAAAACLRERGLPYRVLERGDRVGRSWREHYDRLHLHTIRTLSHLPGLPLPGGYPRYVARAQVVDYLEAYAERFGIEPTFGVEVVHVERTAREGGPWRIEASDGRSFEARHVIVATGLNRVPVAPSWPGQDETTIPISHSRDYRNGANFAGRSVLVVGMGNTGAEIALDLCEHGARAAISVRGPVNIVMRDTLGRPVQQTAMLLARLPTRLADPIGRLLQRLSVGDLSRWGLERPAIAPGAQLRTTGQTPTIDVGTVARIRRGEIEVLPGVERFEREAVCFTDGRRRTFDQVVLCTGYRPELTEIVPASASMLDARGYARDVIGRGEAAGLYLLGFDPYSPGGLLNGIARDAPRVAEAIAEG